MLTKGVVFLRGRERGGVDTPIHTMVTLHEMGWGSNFYLLRMTKRNYFVVYCFLILSGNVSLNSKRKLMQADIIPFKVICCFMLQISNFPLAMNNMSHLTKLVYNSKIVKYQS